MFTALSILAACLMVLAAIRGRSAAQLARLARAAGLRRVLHAPTEVFTRSGPGWSMSVDAWMGVGPDLEVEVVLTPGVQLDWSRGLPPSFRIHRGTLRGVIPWDPRQADAALSHLLQILPTQGGAALVSWGAPAAPAPPRNRV